MALTREQLRNAAIIYKVGMQLGASTRDIKIALITAMQESGLRNLKYGDRDSQGLFQQRPSMDWGTVEQVTNPVYAARAFFKGAGTNSGLLDLKGRNDMSMTQAAQAVQRSAYPDAYAKHIPLIDRAFGRVMKKAGSVPTVDGVPQGDGAYGGLTNTFIPGVDIGNQDPVTVDVADYALSAASPLGTAAPQFETGGGIDNQYLQAFTTPVQPLSGRDFAEKFGGFGKGIDGTSNAIVQEAKKYIGTPYVWGGTSPKGFDCSGFVQYVYGQMGINLPRVSYQQANAGRRIGLDALKPGDLVAWDNSSRNNGADHIAIYIGNGRIIEAPRRGLSVRIRKLGRSEGAWGVRLEK